MPADCTVRRLAWITYCAMATAEELKSMRKDCPFAIGIHYRLRDQPEKVGLDNLISKLNRVEGELCVLDDSI
jgi:hypothetical protein